MGPGALKIIVLAYVFASALGAEHQRDLSFDLDGRIVGGTPATIDEYPHHVSLQVSYFGGTLLSHLCGGSIVAQLWVVTAAHCTINYAPSSLVVRAGTARRYSGGSIHQAQMIFDHPRYNTGATYNYDIALIRVSSRFVFTPIIQPVALPEAGAALVEGSNTSVAGWGSTQPGGSGVEDLLQVQVPVVSKEACRRMYGVSRITDVMLCAGYVEGGKDSCQGDSGGGLVQGSVLVGVVSWGRSCALPNYPGVYADVASLRSWLAQVAGI